MRTPRDISGAELAKRLRRFGYEPVDQVGSHLKLRSNARGVGHTLVVPQHRPLRVGTLRGIIRDVANYLEIEPDLLLARLFDAPR